MNDPFNQAIPLHPAEDLTDINHPLNPLNPNNTNRLLANETDRLLNGGLGTNAGTNLGIDTAKPLAEASPLGTLTEVMHAPIEQVKAAGEIQPIGSDWIEPVNQVIGGSTEIVSPTRAFERK